MKRFLSISLALVLVICCLAATERQAWGYVDPGSGLLALQGFASVVAAVGFYMRRRILALFGRKPEGKQMVPQPAPSRARKAA